jgi:hypothetical protein
VHETLAAGFLSLLCGCKRNRHQKNDEDRAYDISDSSLFWQSTTDFLKLLFRDLVQEDQYAPLQAKSVGIPDGEEFLSLYMLRH